MEMGLWIFVVSWVHPACGRGKSLDSWNPGLSSPARQCQLVGCQEFAVHIYKTTSRPPHLDLGIPSSANPGLTASRERSHEPVELARQGNPCCGVLVLPYSPRRSRPPGLTWSFIQVAYPTVRLDRHHRLLSFVEIARDTVVQPEPTSISYPDPSAVSPHAASRTPQTGLTDDPQDRVSTLCVKT